MRVWTGNAARIEVRNNLVRGTAAGAHRHDGIRVRQSTGVLLSNNTIYGADIGLLIQDSTDVTIRNTISAGNRGDALRVERTALFSEDHDILSGTVYGVATDPTTTSSDPQFVDSAGGDLRPRAVSPAVDTGAEMAAPQLDLEGRSRPLGEGWDIGAYETAPGGLILPPVNLRILKP
jgi:parallel beta-helix repeat protein